MAHHAPRFFGARLEVRARLVFVALIVMASVALLGAFPVMAFAKPGISWVIRVFAMLSGLGAFWMVAATMPYFTRRGPAMVLDGAGIDHLWYGRVPWSDVHGIGLKTTQSSKGGAQHMLVLGVSEPGRFLQRRPAAMRWFASPRKLAAPYGELIVPLNVLDIEPERLRDVALDLRGRVQPPLDDGWYPGIDPEWYSSRRDSQVLLARLEELADEAEKHGPDDANEAETLLVATAMAAESEAMQRNLERLARKQRRMQMLSLVIVCVVVLLLVLRVALVA